MRGQTWGHFPSLKIHRDAVPPGFEPEFEGQYFFEEAGGLEQLPDGLDSMGWKMNREILGAMLEPESLEQHEKTSQMIEVQVGKKNPVHLVIAASAGLVTPADRFSAIDQNGRALEFIKIRRMIPVGARRPVSHAETSYGKFVHARFTRSLTVSGGFMRSRPSMARRERGESRIRAHLDTAPKRWKCSLCENFDRESAVGGDAPKRPGWGVRSRR
jgi:hypothetical protein